MAEANNPRGQEQRELPVNTGDLAILADQSATRAATNCFRVFPVIAGKE
jgi:hypothetical protein